MLSLAQMSCIDSRRASRTPFTFRILSNASLTRPGRLAGMGFVEDSLAALACRRSSGSHVLMESLGERARHDQHLNPPV